MRINVIFLIFIAIKIIEIVEGYKIIYQKTFGAQSDCFDGDTYTPNMVYQSNPTTPIVTCDIACINPQTSNPTAMLIIGPTETGIDLTITQDKLLDPYSIVGIEIIYTKSTNTKLNINLNNWTTQEFNSPKQSAYIDNYSNFNCSPFENKFYRSYIYYQVSSYNGDILISLTTSDPPNSAIGIRHINIWTNCKLGCKTCSDSTTCLDCLIPIKPLSQPSWGIDNLVCAHNYGCEENLAGCNLCYFDGSTQYYCASCQTYRSLSFYGTCYGGQELCATGMMYTTYNCLPKGNNCVVYNSKTNQLSDCDLTKIDIRNYQCANDQTTTIFEYNNYSQYICNCYFYGGFDCQKCFAKGQCSQCKSMMYYDTTENKCKQFTCPDGQYPTTQLQCLPCANGCQKCTNSSNCSKCYDPIQYFNGTECSACPISKCSNCYINGTSCNQCVGGYKLADASTKCVKSCSINHCDQCFTNGTNYCSQCETSYALKSTKDVCINCTGLNCQTCKEGSLNKCDSCVDGFYLKSQDFTCIPCQVSNCLKCVPNSYLQCQTCSSTYSMKQLDKTCETCQVAYCSVCSSDDSQKCNQCSTGYYIKQSDFSCEPCTVANCLSCVSNDQYKCQKCAEGYYLQQSDSSCQPCPFSNCSVCTEQTLSQCTTCKSGNYWIQSDSQCKPCQVQNCSQCNISSAFICDNCDVNYQINTTDYSCFHICEVANCDKCMVSDHTKCDVCKGGYYINPSTLQCETCQVSNCETCYLTSQYKCINCSNGYLIQDAGASCQQCFVNNCLKCNMNDPNKCLLCKNNLSPNPNNGNCEECQVKGCQKCLSSNSLSCEKCNNSNYILSNNGQCSCNLQNCSQCDEIEVGKCLKCNENSVLDNNYVCKRKCQVDYCLQCQPNNPLQCDICEQVYYLDLDYKCQLNNFVTNKQTTTFKLIQAVIDDGIQVKIQFDQELNIIPKISSNILTVEIINYYNFKYSIVSITSREILINLIFNESVKYQTIRIIFINAQFRNLNLIQVKEVEDNLHPFTKLSQEQKDAIAASTAVGNTVSMTVVSSFLPLAIFGHFYILINTIDYTSFLYYLLYINIRHPENVVSFYGIFKNFQFPFIPNILEYIVPNDYVLESPKKFMEMGMDAYFLRNGGQSITICLMITSMYIGARVLKKLPIKPLNNYLEKAIKETWHYGAFLDMLCTVYIYLLVSSLVQFLNFDFTDRLGICILNYSLHFISSILTVTIPFIMFALIYRLKNLKENKDMQTKITTLVGGINLYNENESISSFINLNDDNLKDYKQTTLIQNQLQEIDNKQDQNDIYSLQIHSTINVKSPQDNNNDTKKEFFHSARNIFLNQNEPLDSNDKQNNILSNRNSIILQQSFNNLQSRRKSSSNQSKFMSTEVMLNKKDKKSKVQYIYDRKSSELIFVPEKYMQKKTLRQKLQIKFSKQYNSLLYIRKLFFSLIIVYLYDHCYLQLFLISILNLFISAYIFYIKPFEKNSENIKSGICELLLISIHICIMFLISDKQDEDEEMRIKVGWIIIGISAVIILWNFIILLYQLIIYALTMIKKFILSIFKSKSKIVPMNNQPSLINIQKSAPNKQINSLNKINDDNNKQSILINLQTPQNDKTQTINDQITPINNLQNNQNTLTIPLNNQNFSMIYKSSPSSNNEITPKVNETAQNMNAILFENQQQIQYQQQQQIKLNIINNSITKVDQKSILPQKGDQDDQDKTLSFCNSIKNNRLNIINQKPSNFSSFNALYNSSKNKSSQDLNTNSTPQRDENQKQENQNGFVVKRSKMSKILRIAYDDSTIDYSHLQNFNNLKIVESEQTSNYNIKIKSENQILNQDDYNHY